MSKSVLEMFEFSTTSLSAGTLSSCPSSSAISASAVKVNRKMDGDVVGVESTLGVVLDKEVDEKGNKK